MLSRPNPYGIEDLESCLRNHKKLSKGKSTHFDRFPKAVGTIFHRFLQMLPSIFQKLVMGTNLVQKPFHDPYLGSLLRRNIEYSKVSKKIRRPYPSHDSVPFFRNLMRVWFHSFLCGMLQPKGQVNHADYRTKWSQNRLPLREGGPLINHPVFAISIQTRPYQEALSSHPF